MNRTGTAQIRRVLYALISALVLMSGPVSGAVGEWRTYTRLDIRRIAATENAVWAATGGGIIHSDLDQGTARTYSSTEGISDGNVRSVAVDSVGNVWFGTENGGIVRFVRRSGFAQPVFDQTPLLAGEVIGVRALHVDGDSLLYIGHSTGLTVYDMRTRLVIETYYQLGADGAIRNEQISAVGTLGAQIVVGLESGISIGDRRDNLLLPRAWQFVGTSRFANVRAVVPFENSIYIASVEGVVRETPLGWETTYSESGVNDLTVFDGAVWAATDAGLLQSTDGVTWSIAAGLADSMYSVASVHGKMLVVAGASGTWRIESRTDLSPTKVPGVDFPPFTSFRQMSIDTTGALWIAPGPAGGEALQNVGFLRFKDSRWTQYTPGIPGVPVPPDRSGYRAIAVDAANRLWVGSHGSGIVVGDLSTEPPTFRLANRASSGLVGLSDNADYLAVSAIHIGSNGYVYANLFHSLAWAFAPGFVPGLTSGPTQVTEQYLGTEISPTLEPSALAVDRHGVLWVGLRRGGVVLIDLNGTPADPSDDQFAGSIGSGGSVSLPDPNVTSIAVDRDGAVWVGTQGGLSVFTGAYDRNANIYTLDSRTFSVNNNLPSSVVNAVIVDSANVKWVGTDTGIAQITAARRVINLSSTRLVDPRGKVVSLVYDHHAGAIWIGTERGLNRYQAYDVLGEGTAVQPSENPYRIGLDRRGNDYVLSGEPLTLLVTPGATLRVYTLTGDLVFEATDSGIGQIMWNGTTRSSGGIRVVASGVYLYVAERAGEKAVGKIAVVRDAR